MKELLSELEANRWAWIRQGIDDFREGFLRLPKTISNKREVLIGVYGPTQVGKTTIILKLLGIREDKIQEVSRALRGGRVAGNSATVTASIYHRSKNELFSISYPDGTEVFCETIGEFETAMEAVRQAIENENDFSIKPITIFIAERYFNIAEIDARSQEIQVLDLPGDDSREEKEVRHVTRCLDEYLPHCRLCLLVEISGQMVSLTQLEREQVRDWNYLPNQFRVVLTKTLTSTSVREMIQRGEIHSTETYQAHFLTELNRLLIGKKQVVKIYPLEIGDSWQELMEKEQGLHRKVKPWLEETFLQLMKELNQVESPESEVLQLLDLEGVAKKRKRDDINRLEKDEADIQSKQSKIEVSLRSNQKKQEQFEDDTKQLEKGLDIWDTFKENFQEPSIKEMASWGDRTGAGRKASSLHHEFSDMQAKLHMDFDENVGNWNKSARFLARDCGIRFSELTYSFQEDTIYIHRTVDRYLLKKSLAKDSKSYSKTLEDVKTENLSRLKELCEKKAEFHKERVVNQIYAKSLLSKENCKKYEELLQQKSVLVDEQNNLQSQIQLLKMEWDQDIERSKQLYDYLKKSFVKQVSTLQEQLCSITTGIEEKWIYHQYWNLITNDAERVFSHDKNHNR